MAIDLNRIPAWQPLVDGFFRADPMLVWLRKQEWKQEWLKENGFYPNPTEHTYQYWDPANDWEVEYEPGE